MKEKTEIKNIKIVVEFKEKECIKMNEIIKSGRELSQELSSEIAGIIKDKDFLLRYKNEYGYEELVLLLETLNKTHKKLVENEIERMNKVIIPKIFKDKAQYHILNMELFGDISNSLTGVLDYLKTCKKDPELWDKNEFKEMASTAQLEYSMSFFFALIYFKKDLDVEQIDALKNIMKKANEKKWADCTLDNYQIIKENLELFLETDIKFSIHSPKQIEGMKELLENDNDSE